MKGLPEIRRILTRALLAAPLAVGACHSQSPTGSGSGTGTGSISNQSPPDAKAAAKKVCKHQDIDITGCGGGEVVLDEPFSACGLTADQDLPKELCDAYCGTFDTRSCRTYENQGKQEVYCDAANPCMGRMASAGTLDGARYADAIADHLALARRMEAHSVAAFQELEADLARFDAPAALVEACRRAAADEARHAAAIARLLRARGIEPERLERATPGGFDSLLALALHNEREGLGEAWGAVVAMHQSTHAPDPDVRDAMATIADEETAHAELSFAISAWARTALGPDAAAELDAARRAAYDRLHSTLGHRPAEPAALALGWPSPTASASMIAELAALTST